MILSSIKLGVQKNRKKQIYMKPTSAKSSVRGEHHVLVGGFSPFEKYARQNGLFPQVGMKIKKNMCVAT